MPIKNKTKKNREKHTRRRGCFVVVSGKETTNFMSKVFKKKYEKHEQEFNICKEGEQEEEEEK